MAWPPSRHAWRRPAPDRAGTEKPSECPSLSVIGMDIALKHCFINVTDAEQALAFYRDGLGLELRNDVANDGFRWITLSPPAQPDVEIVVSDFLGSSPADRDTI